MSVVGVRLDASRAIEATSRFLESHARMLRSNAEDATNFPQRHVRQHPRGYKHRTGKTIQATKGTFVKTRKGVLIRVKNTRKHARALDGGSGLYGSRGAKYPIRAKGGGALKFTARDGREVIVRQVMHPGIKPTHFLFNATQATGRVFVANVHADMARIARRF